MVEQWILPHLSKGKRGFKTRWDLTKVIKLILKRMKTGCRWRELSVKEYFGDDGPGWQTVYYYFHKWSNDGSFKAAWVHLLSLNKGHIDFQVPN
ncbi:transposase [Niabella yanshanensis]|uniref:Transposase n=1 Tax=Niabella yanshanensis TaxID=577386 RepID=A0ABZ0WC89_9BACT|nr:transposase [Niabella yanshanensis]WQD39362.1 transposase [Niabella yanshanensis]